MLEIYKTCLIWAVVLQITSADQLPAFIQKCSLSDPKFNECVLESTRKALPYLLKGDEKFGLPQLLPLQLPIMKLDVSEDVHFDLTNGIAEWNDDFRYTIVDFDFKRKTLFLSSIVSQSRCNVDFEATGQLLDKPIHEKGKANMTFDDFTINVTATLDFKTVDGKKYLEVTSADVLSFSKFKFMPYNNEIVGEPLSDEQRKAYTPYYQRIGLAIRKDVKKVCEDVILLVMNAIFKLEPFDTLFLP